jgi:hypothetical protein
MSKTAGILALSSALALFEPAAAAQGYGGGAYGQQNYGASAGSIAGEPGYGAGAAVGGTGHGGGYGGQGYGAQEPGMVQAHTASRAMEPRPGVVRTLTARLAMALGRLRRVIEPRPVAAIARTR